MLLNYILKNNPLKVATMVKRFILYFLLIFICTPCVFSQNYEKYIQQGKDFYSKKEYLTALERFDLAYEISINKLHKDEARKWKNVCKSKIREQQEDLKLALNETKLQKKKSDSLFLVANKETEKNKIALRKVEKMQKKLQTAIFDKAVKLHYPDWLGYSNYHYWDERREFLMKIDTLDLSNNSLQFIPEEVKECKSLKSINLIQNPDINWNSCIKILSELKMLEEIKLSIYDLDSIPLEFRSKITVLEVLNKGLTKIPENILRLRGLKGLYINGNNWNNNNLDSLPDELFKMENLEIVDLSYCNIKVLNSQVSNLKKLKELNIAHNKITSLPNELFYLREISNLYIQNNALTEISSEIVNLRQLKYIDVSNNPIIYLSPEVITFINEVNNNKQLNNIDYAYITTLDLSNLSISTLTENIEKYEHLIELDLSNNKVVSLPKPLVKLNYLSGIDLSNNLLKKLPIEICGLKNLKLLFLGYNHIIELDPEIRNLKYLNELDLSNNQLKHFPEEVFELSSLTYLNLENNNIDALPDDIIKLKKLEYLNIQGNNLSENNIMQLQRLMPNCQIYY